MKVLKVIIISALCISFSGCNSTSKDMPISADQEDSSGGTVTEAVSNPYFTPDYSNHTASDEASYETKLADLSLLKQSKPAIATNELTADWSWMKFAGFQANDAILGYDVRNCDISNEDLSVVKNFNDLTFDTNTVWPDILPDGFDPKEILEFNKNPGLGIRTLHKQGITGDGVGIAIIDQALLPSHEQYKDNLMLYERIHCGDESASMHGPAVASIAVGKDTGVAPGARLYYIADTYGHFTNGYFEFDASIIADCILRILDMNKYLPKDEKIRVISISRGYTRQDKGYDAVTAAIKKADEQNVFVLTTSTNEYYKNFSLFGIDRDYPDDPDSFHSYQPAAWISNDFYAHPSRFDDFILFPIGSRTYAGCTGEDVYAIGRNGGLSWAVPWCAGLYALCCQVKPDITPQEFIDIVNSTAVTTEITHNSQTYKLGKIINPAGVIEKLKN